MMRPSRWATLAVTVPLTVSLLATGCGADSGGDSSGERKKIALIVGLKGDDFYGSMACGATAAAERLGVELDIQGPTKWDAPEQISVLNAVLAGQPDAILIAPVDDTALQVPLEQAAARGIKVVLVDTTLKDPALAVAQVTSDNELAGKAAAEEIVKETGGRGSVLTVNTQPGVSTVEARVRGFEAGLKAATGLTYLGQQFSGDDAARASTVITASLAAHPDLSAVFATNTLTGQGAATGIMNAHKTGQIKLIGFDANPSGVQALNDGAAQAQVVLKPLDIGTSGVEQAVNALTDKPVEKLIHTGALVANKGNLNSPEVQKYLYRANCTG